MKLSESSGGLIESVSILFLIVWKEEIQALNITFQSFQSIKSIKHNISSINTTTQAFTQLIQYYPNIMMIIETLTRIIKVTLLLTEDAVLIASKEQVSMDVSNQLSQDDNIESNIKIKDGITKDAEKSLKNGSNKSKKFIDGSVKAFTVNSSVDELDNNWTDPSTASVIFSPFYYINSILYNLNLHLPLHQILISNISEIESKLTSIYSTMGKDLEKIRALILLQIDDFSLIKLRDVELIDSLIMLVNDWQPTPLALLNDESIDQSFVNISSIIKDHFTSSLESIFHWTSNDDSDEIDTTLNILQCDIDNSSSMKGLHVKDDNDDDNILYDSEICRQLLQKNRNLLKKSIDLCSIDTVDNLSRRLIFIHVILQLGGLDHLQMQGLDLGSVHELAWNLIVDDRLGLEDYPAIRRKCYELMKILEENQIPRHSMNQNEANTSGIDTVDSIAASAALVTEDQFRVEMEDNGRRRQRGSSNAAYFSPPTALTVGEFLISTLCDQDNCSGYSILLSFYRNHILGKSILIKDKEYNSSVLSNNNSNEIESLVIYAKQKQSHKLLYSYLSILIELGKSEKMVRRRLVNNIETIFKEILDVDSIFGLQCCINITFMIIEFTTRFESNIEIAISTFLIKGLNCYNNMMIQSQICFLIYKLGQEGPGFIHRCLCRCEVEIPLIHILSSKLYGFNNKNIKNFQIIHNKLIINALKACSVLVRDYNGHPSWIQSSFLYHWRHYNMGLVTRPMLRTTFIEILNNLIKNISKDLQMQIFSIILSIGANLFYSCCDGVFSSSDSIILQENTELIHLLKNMIIKTMIIWLPNIYQFLTSYKKVVSTRTYTQDDENMKFDFDVNIAYEELIQRNHQQQQQQQHDQQQQQHDDDEQQQQEHDEQEQQEHDESENNIDLEILSNAIETGELSLHHQIITNNDHLYNLKMEDTNQRPSHTGIRLAESTPADNNITHTIEASDIIEGKEERRLRIQSKSLGTRALHKIMKTIKQTRTGHEEQLQNNSILNNETHSSSQYSIIKNNDLKHISTINFGIEAIEYLTERVIDLEHAFFCMDTMFPLVNYLQNISLFQHKPVIACTVFFMAEYKKNLHIQRYGYEVIKTFAENQIGITSIALQTPAALIHATTLLSDMIEIQCSFCRIINSVILFDDIARENFVRFNVHLLLERMILKFHKELSRLACIVVANLSTSDSYVIQMCQSSTLVDSILQLLEEKSQDLMIQIEGLRALQAIFRVPEMLIAKSKSLSTVKVLRRIKKMLQTLLRSNDIEAEGYDREVLEAILSHPLLAKASCIIT